MGEAQPVPVSEGVAIEFNADGRGKNFAIINGQRIPVSPAETRFLVAGGVINKPRNDGWADERIIYEMNRLYELDWAMAGKVNQAGPYTRDYLSFIRHSLRQKLNGGG